MGIFSRRKYITKKYFPDVIENLSISFEALREEYIFGSLSQLKRERIDVSKISRDIAPGSDLDDLLKGFQLTSMIGIAWDYIKGIDDQIHFDKLLSSHLNAQEGSRAWNFREKYVDCQGNIDTLSQSLADDVHKAIGFPEPRLEFLIQFRGGAQALIMLCQTETCIAFGDNKRAQSIRKIVRQIV